MSAAPLFGQAGTTFSAGGRFLTPSIAAPTDGPLLLLAGVAGGMVAYLALRVRDAAADRPDPDLGVKVAYHFFFSVGVLLILLGLSDQFAAMLPPPTTTRLVGVLNIDTPRNAGSGGRTPLIPVTNYLAAHLLPQDPVRDLTGYGWPPCCAGLTCCVLTAALLRLTTNARDWPAVRRVFAGGRLGVLGLVVLVQLLAVNRVVFDTVLSKPVWPADGSLDRPVSMLAVWGPALGFHVWLMHRRRGLPY